MPRRSRRRLTDEIGEQLAGWGTVARLEIRGRVSGRPIEVAVGYVQEPDGSILVAAGSPETAWARNLEADGACRVSIGGAAWAVRAVPLEGDEANSAVRELILRYGTPAEGLGRGPVFRLVRDVEAAARG